MAANPTDIRFFDFHKPALEDGEYTVSLSQTVNEQNSSNFNSTYTQSLSFHIAGPRFDLDPSLIHSVYPPKGGKGNYMAVLPSMVLNRNTLPWERSPILSETSSNSASWLFLLLIDETEKDKVTENYNTSLSSLAPYFVSSSNGATPLTTDDLSRNPTAINYLAIDNTLIDLFPTSLSELQYLSYTRIKEASSDNAHDKNEEKAVLLCNRLPQRGHNSTVYLISIENNYTETDANTAFGGVADGNNYIFPLLYKWEFHTFDEQLYCLTEDGVAKLKQANPTINVPDLSSLYDQLYTHTAGFITALNMIGIKSAPLVSLIKVAAKLPGSDFHDLLLYLSGGFAPLTTNAAAIDISMTGSVNLPYHKIESNQGDISPSFSSTWYRGPLTSTAIDLSTLSASFPLVTLANVTTPRAPNQASDLFLWDANGQADTSYAAAYELGRLTALDDIDFANEFFKWKSQTAQASRLASLQVNSNYPNFPSHLFRDESQVKLMPQHVLNKFTAWKELKGIPYRYLLPSTDLLPNESIRFFQLDNIWINAFICGAFSIGHTVEGNLRKQLQALFATDTVTGFLINSLVVSGWPDFEVGVTSATEDAISLLRKDNVDKNIGLYLFNGSFNELVFHLHPGKVHSGFLWEDGEFKKNGSVTDFSTDANGLVHFQQQNSDQSIVCTPYIKTNQTIDITGLLNSQLFSLNSPTQTAGNTLPVAHFAAMMLEGVPSVVFSINT